MLPRGALPMPGNHDSHKQNFNLKIAIRKTASDHAAGSGPNASFATSQERIFADCYELVRSCGQIPRQKKPATRRR